LVGGANCQVAAGLIELKDHNIAGGNLMLFFGSFFMVTGALGMLLKPIWQLKGFFLMLPSKVIPGYVPFW